MAVKLISGAHAWRPAAAWPVCMMRGQLVVHVDSHSHEFSQRVSCVCITPRHAWACAVCAEGECACVASSSYSIGCLEGCHH